MLAIALLAQAATTPTPQMEMRDAIEEQLPWDETRAWSSIRNRIINRSLSTKLSRNATEVLSVLTQWFERIGAINEEDIQAHRRLASEYPDGSCEGRDREPAGEGDSRAGAHAEGARKELQVLHAHGDVGCAFILPIEPHAPSLTRR